MHRLAIGLARGMAVLGGIVLSALILLTCVSVLGRLINTILHSGWIEAVAGDLATTLLATGIGPVAGDFELVEACIAFAIFAFMPLAQVSGGHASVDIFTSGLSERTNRVLTLIWELLFAAVLITIAWRLYAGMAAKMRYGETTMLLQFPIWWAYGASFFGAAVAALIGVYVAIARALEVVTGRIILQAAGGAGH
ncbi:TRAP transporter small permease [Pseudooceanicola sp.]|uniref:TRAP transporter small permease n=1 Tax=Pseudooceanicola sp. TaxID=1914328 RepID=UPI0026055738|nr:TRAP transporter small permease [Pseudooceanicola sp.]MDF1855206.1 TRAP transporter small permease [Pseudooceanicola sp.]